MPSYGGNERLIGYYIHYTPALYFKHGLKYPVGSINTWSYRESMDYLDQVHTNMVNTSVVKATESAAKDLQTKLNYFYTPKKGKKIEGQLSTIYKNALEKSLYEFIKDYIEKDGVEIDFEHLKTEFSEGYDPKYFEGAGRLKEIKAVNQTNLRNLKEKIEKLINLVNKNLEKDGLSLEQGTLDEDARKRFGETFKQVKKLKEDSERLFKNLEGIRRGSTQIYLNKDGVATAANSLVQDYNYLLTTFVNYKAVVNGLMGEYMVPAILFALQQKTNKEATKIMQDFAKTLKNDKTVQSEGNSFRLSGKDETKKGLFSVNFFFNPEDLNYKTKKSKSNQAYNTDENGDLIAVSATQDKVDVEITLGEEEYNLSVKNYNLKNTSELSLFSGNLLRLIQEETDFINHYLNIVSIRDNLQLNNISDELRNKAKRIMKELILIKALTGGVQIGTNQFTKKANYFVVHDSSADLNGFYVYDMNSLTSKILNLEKEYFNIKYGVSDFYLNLYQGDFKGPSAGVARALRMVRTMAVRHIDVQLKLGALKN